MYIVYTASPMNRQCYTQHCFLEKLVFLKKQKITYPTEICIHHFYIFKLVTFFVFSFSEYKSKNRTISDMFSDIT
jgi:hypothetical protein